MSFEEEFKGVKMFDALGRAGCSRSRRQYEQRPQMQVGDKESNKQGVWAEHKEGSQGAVQNRSWEAVSFDAHSCG